MIRINLLPHREEKRKQRKAAFVALLALGGAVGVVVVLLVSGYNARQIAIQDERNQVLRLANAELDKTIGSIATLREEINALKARQQAVEDLQGDRNQPVLLLDELVKQTPDGVYLKSFKQEGQRVLIVGNAQSQERVAEFLRNIGRSSVWLEKPDLSEVKAITLPGSKFGKRVVEFTMTVNIKRARDKEADAAALKAGALKPTTGTAGVTGPAAPARPAAPAAAAQPASK